MLLDSAIKKYQVKNEAALPYNFLTSSYTVYQVPVVKTAVHGKASIKQSITQFLMSG